MVKNFLFKRYIKIGDIKLPLDFSNPHEKQYYKTIKNDDFLISKRLVREGDRILDIGANIGFTALLYVSFGAKEVYAFEPVLKLYKRIKSLKTHRIKAFNIALSNYVGQNEMFLSSAHNQGHSLNHSWPSRFGHVFEKKLVQTVKISTLDKVLPKDNFDFVKIDVEGLELEVIEGGINFFKRNYNSIIQIEIYPWQFKQTNQLLTQFYNKTYVPQLNENEELKFIEINSFNTIEDIKFIGPPNYIYANFEIN